MWCVLLLAFYFDNQPGDGLLWQEQVIISVIVRVRNVSSVRSPHYCMYIDVVIGWVLSQIQYCDMSIAYMYDHYGMIQNGGTYQSSCCWHSSRSECSHWECLNAGSLHTTNVHLYWIDVLHQCKVDCSIAICGASNCHCSGSIWLVVH